MHSSLGRLEKVIAFELANQTVGGNSVNWYDATGMVQSINGDSTTYSYDLVGNLSRMTLSNGVMTDYEYDELNRLTRMVNYVDGGSEGFDKDLNEDFDLTSANDLLRGSFEYTVDLFGKRTHATEMINAGSTNASTDMAEIDWVYDELGRLTKETYDFDSVGTAGNEATYDFEDNYKFDLVGNRISKTHDQEINGIDEAISSFYDDNDRLLREWLDEDVPANNGVDKTTFYQYGTNNASTVQTRKTAYAGELSTPSGAKLSETIFTYNLQGRLQQIYNDTDGSSGPLYTTSQYEYSDDGMRVSRESTGYALEDIEREEYLIDANNPTGYAQVIEDRYTQTDTSPTNLRNSFVLGHDVIAQASAAADIMSLMYDGHGSTRAVLDASADIPFKFPAQQLYQQLFAYDAYGNLLDLPGFASAVGQAITTLLYSGEQTDGTGLQYLRARYYDAGTGRFNRLDPFAGNFNDPQSLHKYLYAHGDPVNGVDLTGMFRAALGNLLNLIRLNTITQLAQVGGNQSGPLFANKTINGRIALVNIVVDDTDMPDNFVVGDIQRKMQTVINRTRLAIFVSLQSATPGPNETPKRPQDAVELGKFEYENSVVPIEWRHAVIFGTGQGNFIMGKTPIASTPGDLFTGGRGTLTTINLNNADKFRLAKKINNADENATFWANVLLHEVFSRGIIGTGDQNRRGTRLTTGESPGGSLLQLEQSDVQAIHKAL